MAVGILAGLVYIERMMGALDQGHLLAASDQERDQLLDQGGLAAAREPRESKDSHV
jgi:hypothetical protein